MRLPPTVRTQRQSMSVTDLGSRSASFSGAASGRWVALTSVVQYINGEGDGAADDHDWQVSCGASGTNVACTLNVTGGCGGGRCITTVDALVLSGF